MPYEMKATGKYDSNTPCQSGHIGLRYSQNGGCVQFAIDRAKAAYIKRKSASGPKPRKKARPLNELPSRAIASTRRYKAKYIDGVFSCPDRLEAHRAKRRDRENARRNGSVGVRINSSFSGRIRYAIKKAGKTTRQILYQHCGYTIADLIKHLERQFVDGMSWDNYGRNGWVIDHITPVSSFDLEDGSQFRACWGLGNLRPIWHTDNCSKKDKRLFLL